MTRAIVCAALTGILSALQQLAPSSLPSHGIEIHAWVEKADGLPAADLSSADFEVLVDGTKVPIQQLVPRRTAASIIVLIDTSRSAGWERKKLEGHLDELISTLGPSARSTIATFGSRNTFPPFKSGPRDAGDEIRAAMERRDTDGYGASPLWDAVHEAVAILSREPGPRALLLLTDGRATGNYHGLHDAADYAMMHGVSISAVLRHSSQWIRQGGDLAVLVQPGVPIQALTVYTGGMYFTFPEAQDDQARAVFRRVASTLTATHIFSFVPPQFDGLPHRLVIRPTKTYTDVHAPRAFVAPFVAR
jgi:hypothetical protein